MTASNEAAPSAQELRERVENLFEELTGTLGDLVRIRSISPDGAHAEQIAHSANVVADLFRAAGLPEVEILTAPGPDGTPGNPAVVGRRPGPPGAPTVMLYAHHDVQPVADDWDTDPFEPTIVGERMYGRGAADDGAGIVAHLGALQALGEDLPVGVVVFVEGEEECGSPTFASFLAGYRDKLAADVIVVADSDNWRIGVPALTTSLRGVVDLTVTLEILEHAVHSGMFGGPLIDAPLLMARLLATLHDSRGDVAVRGLGHGPETDVDYPEADFRADAAVLPGVRLTGTGSVGRRLWHRPAITLIGFDVTSTADASNTIAPRATVKLSLRVPPGEDAAVAQRVLADHLLYHAPFGAKVTVEKGAVGRSWQAPAGGPAVAAARAALAEAWGVAAVDVGQGGSIPFVSDLTEVFPGAEILITGVEDPDSRAHSGNESVHLGELRKAVLAEALLLARLGAGAGAGEAGAEADSEGPAAGADSGEGPGAEV